MNIVIPNDKPEIAAAMARAVEVFNSENGQQFQTLLREDAPLGVLSEWACSTLDRSARAQRKLLVYSVTYADPPIVPSTDPTVWKAAHPEIVAAFDIQFRQLPPRAQP